MSGNNVLLGICGGIAAYKSCGLVRMLKKDGCEVRCILTKSGSEFVTALTLQTLSEAPVATDMFDLIKEREIGHISLAKFADVVVVAPATANIIAKVACGICDDMLSTTICATKAPVVFAPAMNAGMWENPVTQKNVATLKNLGYCFIEPETGKLACGDEGPGRMAELEKIRQVIIKQTTDGFRSTDHR